MLITIKKDTIRQSCVYGAYFIFLCVVYSNVLTVDFRYQGYFYKPISSSLWIIPFLFFLFVAMFVPREIRRPSALVSLMLYLLVYAPFLVVSYYSGGNAFFQLIPFWIFFGAVIVLIGNLGRLPALPTISLMKLSDQYIIIALLVFWALSYLILFYFFGFNAPPSLIDVYSTRLDARDVLQSAAPGTGHLLRFVSNVVNPLFIAIGLLRKTPLLVIVGVAGQFIIYTFDGTKSTLLSVFLFFGFYYLFSHKNNSIKSWNLTLYLLLLITGFYVLDLFLSLMIKNWLFTHTFTRRFIFVPGHVTFVYLDFFSSHAFFGVKGLVDTNAAYGNYPGPGFLIADHLYNNAAANVNANFLADGYARLGAVGSIVSISILCSFLWLYDSISEKKNRILGLLLMLLPAFAITNTGITTLITTHGLGGILIVMLLLPIGAFSTRSR